MGQANHWFERATVPLSVGLWLGVALACASLSWRIASAPLTEADRLTLLGLSSISLLLVFGLGGLLYRAHRLLRQHGVVGRNDPDRNILRHVLDSAPCAIIAGDTQRGTYLFNRAAEQMTGYCADEVTGKLLPLMLHDPAELEARAAALSRELGRVVQPRESIVAKARFGMPDEHEWTYIRKDGSRIPVLVTMMALDPPQGTAFMGLAQDISERKRAEAELKSTNTALASALQAAEAADRAKSAFLATMSHELRTPLNSIIGFTGLILQGLPGPLNDEQRKQLGMVRASAQHLLALINDILDISKIEAGELTIHRAAFDLHASLARTASLAEASAKAGAVALRLQLAPEISTFHGDERRLEQVVLNLLNNAFKFTERGTVTLSTRPIATGIEIAVADTGIGIQEQHLGELFEPFKQIDSTLSRHHEGTGLGLAISRKLVRLMGGEIRVASRFGEGSVFTIEVPSQAAQASRPASPASEGRFERTGEAGLIGARSSVVEQAADESRLPAAQPMAASARRA